MLHRSENVKFKRKLFHPSMSVMDFICMDLIGEFHPPSRCGHCFALSACCMLTGFTWCVPLKTMTEDEVVTAYKNHIACPFGGSVKILTDNGTEFKVNSSRKLSPSLEQKCLSSHHHTGHRAMER